MTTEPIHDVFARIATLRLSGRAHRLVEPEPSPLPNRTLPMDTSPGEAPFKPGRPLDTGDQLQRELNRYRRRFSRFLRDLAPSLESQRTVTPIPSFDWREETEADRADFAGILAGERTWQRVSIPHFGPPLGRAVTYYRTRIRITRAMLRKGSLFLCFRGVDYRCTVYFNGICLGAHEGFFAPFELDCTRYARAGENVLLIRVENDALMSGHYGGPDDLGGDKIYAASGLGYDEPTEGWHHCPPGMGICQPVSLEARAPLFLADVFVRPLPEEGRAEAWIEVHNGDAAGREITLELAVFGQNFRKRVFRPRHVRPRTTQIRGHGDVDQFANPDVAQLMGPGTNYLRIPMAMPEFRSWEPETPWLYQLQIRLLAEDGTCVDTARQQFGMRSFRQDETSRPKGKLYLNGQEIRLRGANTMGHLQQCVLRGDWDQLRDDILLAKICGMNFLRLTQRPVQKEVYEYCDRLGLMNQTDLPLFGVLRRNQLIEAVKQTQELERLIRPHPSSILISYINEPYPNATGKPHRHLIREELEEFFDMASRAVRMSNPDRVIKACDGDYDPPTAIGMPDNHCYCGWYIGHGLDLGKLHRGYWIPVRDGWHYGCGEFGAEGLDPVEVMRKYYPREWIPSVRNEDGPWQPDKVALAQSYRFHFLWYDTPETMADWVEASQRHQARITRLMTEAFRRDPRMNSFAIHLFIDAWPAGWMKTIMDVDRQPKQAYFAYRDALTPLMVSLRCDRSAFHAGEPIEVEAWVCNDRNEVPAGTELRYGLVQDGEVLQSGRAPARVGACCPVPQGLLQFTAPNVQARGACTIRLGLVGEEGVVLHDTHLAVSVFPIAPALRGAVRIVGSPRGPAAQLARELGTRRTFGGGFSPEVPILIDDMKAFARDRVAITQAVRQGAVALFLELPPGRYRIGGSPVVVEDAGMGPRHFVSRATGHPLVNGFEPDDFSFWHDASADSATPLLLTVLDVAGWVQILQSGNGSWQGTWRAAPAAVEKTYGRGTWRICQVKLGHRTRTNPAARIFAARLLGLED